MLWRACVSGGLARVVHHIPDLLQPVDRAGLLLRQAEHVDAAGPAEDVILASARIGGVETGRDMPPGLIAEIAQRPDQRGRFFRNSFST